MEVRGIYNFGLGGIEVGDIEFGIEEHIFWRFSDFNGIPEKWRKARIYNTKSGVAYFNTPLGRVKLDEVMRTNN